MGKTAIKTFTPFHVFLTTSFKKEALLFDSIFIDGKAIEVTKKIFNDKTVNREYLQKLEDYLTELEFLFEKGILENYESEFDTLAFLTAKDDSNARQLISEYENFLKNRPKLNDLEFGALIEKYLEGFDIRTRYSALAMQNQKLDILPLLSAQTSFEVQDGKEEILSFVLNNLPTPDETTSWEQIIDFRNDSDSKAKYYALIHWVNTVAASKRPLQEIEDEYNYLYSQYCEHFRLHKMKTNLTTWEMIVAGGIDVLTSMQVYQPS